MGGGAVQFGDTEHLASLVFAGNTALAAGQRTFNTVADTTFTGILAGDGASLTKTGDGILTLTNANTYDGGTQIQGGSIRIANDAALGGGAITFGGGALASTTNATRLISNDVAFSGGATIGDSSSNGAFVFRGANNVLASGAQTITTNVATTFANGISGAGGLTKSDSGTFVLAGLNTYAGPTDLTAGTLLVNGTNSGLGQVNVAAGAVLGGTGLMNGLVNVTGALAPGNVGQTGLLGAGALTLGGSSLTTIQMTGTNPLLRGSDFDAINVLTGALTYGGDLFFDLSFGSTFEQSTTTTFNIFDFTGSQSGNFASVMGSSTVYGPLSFTNNLGLWTTTTSDPNTTIQFSQATGDVQFIVVPEVWRRKSWPHWSKMKPQGFGMPIWMVRSSWPRCGL
jgi:fibronectin-binding autotransporter adhesin